MTNDAEAATAPSAIRAAIELDRLPWIRPLAAAYTRRFVSVASLFAGDPSSPAAWREAVARVQGDDRRDPAALATLLTRQLDARGAPAPAREAARRLADPSAVAVVTGQQAGLFGGPLYTLLKAVSAVQLARRLSSDQRVPAVAVFWVEGDDHDWQEIRSTSVLDADGLVQTIALPDLDGAGDRPVNTLRLDERIADTLAALQATLPATEFTTALLDDLRRCYAAGTGLADACARWMDRLLGEDGLVVFDASDGAARPLVADLFARELREGGLVTRLARDGGARMQALGHEPQVEPADDATGLFYLAGGGRTAIRRTADGFLIGAERRSTADLVAEAETVPAHFSPNVLLRPLVQDRLFPTVAYVAGPAELAYQAQLRDAYRAFHVAMPLLQSRATSTLLDAGALRFLERTGLTFESLQAQDESALNALLQRLLPPGLDAALDAFDRQAADRIHEMRDAAIQVDPTLGGAAETTLSRVREAVRTFHGKVVQAAKRKDDTLRRQFQRTRALAFPNGAPQERILGIAFAVNRYGPAVARRLLEVLPDDPGRHYLIVL